MLSLNVMTKLLNLLDLVVVLFLSVIIHDKCKSKSMQIIYYHNNECYLKLRVNFLFLQ